MLLKGVEITSYHTVQWGFLYIHNHNCECSLLQTPSIYPNEEYTRCHPFPVCIGQNRSNLEFHR